MSTPSGNAPKKPRTSNNLRGVRTDSDGKVRYNATGPAPSISPASLKLSALPSPIARGIAFASILVGGLLGGLIGYGFMRVQYRSGHDVAKAVGSAIGALVIAGGTAVLSVLVLRAMGEWRNVDSSVGRVQLGDRE